MKIKAIHPESPLFGTIRPGWELVSINKKPVIDSIDYQYKSADDKLTFVFITPNGKREKFSFGIDRPFDLGISFEDDKILRCKANCIFCFVHQQPKGMRRSLYVKDDDFRLSFKHGNFVTLTNLNNADIKRIIDQNLSPLYVSVHATDDRLRRCLLRNEKIPSVMTLMKKLIKNNITFHTQVVVCPGVNDGENLDKTINDLAELYPGVQTIGIVPVGLTKYRKRLIELKTYDSKSANNMIDYINDQQKKYIDKIGTRMVFAADEFYVLADRKLPRLFEYEEMEQFENGIGMLRWTVTEFNRRRYLLKNIRSKKRIALITGMSAYKIIDKYVIDYIRRNTSCKVDVIPVENMFWGKTVTVSGLLTGQDILRKIKSIKKKYDCVMLPPNCINDDGLFLDDISIDDLNENSKLDIHIGSYFIADTLREVLN